MTNIQMATAAMGTEMYRDTPKSSKAVPMPANSVTTSPTLAMAKARTAKAERRRENCSRISAASPCRCGRTAGPPSPGCRRSRR